MNTGIITHRGWTVKYLQVGRKLRFGFWMSSPTNSFPLNPRFRIMSNEKGWQLSVWRFSVCAYWPSVTPGSDIKATHE